jgi:uncharacterized protein (DUF2342 family)
MTAGTLDKTTSGFVLAASVTILFNTALALAKDVSAPLTAHMKQLTGHHWTTHGIADLVVFLVLGFLFSQTKLGEKLGANAVTAILTGSVIVASLGLAIWYLFV